MKYFRKIPMQKGFILVWKHKYEIIIKKYLGKMFLENSIWKYKSAIKEGYWFLTNGNIPLSSVMFFTLPAVRFPELFLALPVVHSQGCSWHHFLGLVTQSCSWHHFLGLVTQSCSWLFLLFVSQTCSWLFLLFVSLTCSWLFLLFVSQTCCWRALHVL